MKRLLTIPIVFLLVISCVIPFTTSAASDDYPGLPSVSDVIDRYGSYDSYLYFNAVYSSNSIYGFYIDLTNGNPSYSSGVLSAYGTGRQISFTRSDVNSEFRDTGRSTFNRSFTFDFNTLTTSLTDYSPIFNVVLVLNGELVYDSDSLEFGFEISFVHDLTGSVDRSSSQSSITQFDYNFVMNVDNHLSSGFQIFMAIVDPGTNVSFYTLDEENSSLCNAIISNNIHYMNIRTVDAYFFNLDTFDLGSLLVNGSSCWSYIPPQTKVTFSFPWEGIDLEKDVQYDVIVYAIENNTGYVSLMDLNVDYSDSIYDRFGKSSRSNVSSYNNSGYSNPFAIDYSSLLEVYRSTFSVSNPAVYNPNFKSSWFTPNSSTSNFDDIFGHLNGYYDFADGTPHFDRIDLDYSSSSFGSNSPNYPDSSGSSGSYRSSSYDSLLSQGNGVFRFFASVFSYLPGSFTTILNLSLWTFLIFAIIRRVT